jgi:hypothetical protein
MLSAASLLAEKLSMEIGTSTNFSARARAVTTISSTPVPSCVAVPVDGAAVCAAIWAATGPAMPNPIDRAKSDTPEIPALRTRPNNFWRLRVVPF